MEIDVFNGDADGICALIQLRLIRPIKSKLITGVKRDIQLLQEVEAKAGDQLTVLDISLAKNRDCLEEILQCGAHVLYVDHHQAGEIPEHPRLQTIINTDSTTCTSLLVNDYLQGQHLAWAVTAAFGDNLNDSALKAAAPLLLSEKELQQLKGLGICINYNSYGSSLADLHIPPTQLYKELSQYVSPFDFINENSEGYQNLLDAYSDDMTAAQEISPEYQTDQIAVYLLPDKKWARRVSGVFGNYLANKNPHSAHAVLTYNNQEGYQVSVRAPLTTKVGADEICSLFASGGGRKAAAGINHLPQTELGLFISAFADQYSSNKKYRI